MIDFRHYLNQAYGPELIQELKVQFCASVCPKDALEASYRLGAYDVIYYLEQLAKKEPEETSEEKPSL